MQPGQKLTYNGKEVCLFPLPIINITQVSAPDSFSHCCGHAIDCVGQRNQASLYAPVSMRLISVGNSANGNDRIWQSESEVITPVGNHYICVEFVHDDNPPYSTIGSRVSQGELIAHTGTTGFVTGDHTHIDSALGTDRKLISYGIVCSGGNECYALQDSTNANNIFFRNGTEVINDMGLSFKNFTYSDVKKFNFMFYGNRKRKIAKIMKGR